MAFDYMSNGRPQMEKQLLCRRLAVRASLRPTWLLNGCPQSIEQRLVIAIPSLVLDGLFEGPTMMERFVSSMKRAFDHRRRQLSQPSSHPQSVAASLRNLTNEDC